MFVVDRTIVMFIINIYEFQSSANNIVKRRVKFIFNCLFVFP